MLGGGEPGRWIGADFADDRRGAMPCDPGTDWSAPLGTKGLHHLLDLLVQRGIIELVQMGRVQPAHQGRDDR